MEIRIGVVGLLNVLWFSETVDYESCGFDLLYVGDLYLLYISLCRML